MDEHVDEHLPQIQGVVSQKMGRCILRLQQLELVIKAILAFSKIEGHPEDLLTNLERRKASFATKTLGQLVGELTGAYFLPGVGEDTESPPSKDQDPTRAYFRMTCVTQLEEAAYEQTKIALRELVDVRNELVHHFMSRFDLFSVGGCEGAIEYLDKAFALIDKHDRELRQMAKTMDEGRKELGAFFASEAGEDMLVYGIMPGGGEMHWPSTLIVQWLGNAERVCAREGWTSLVEAIHYIRGRNPDLCPKKYGRSSWRQILHESQLFELVRRTDTSTGERIVWYRSRPTLLSQ